MNSHPAAVGIDSNTLSYLIDATSEAYDPFTDDALLATERLAMVRTFFYSKVLLWVPPTVAAEYCQIQDPDRFDSHWRTAQYLLQDQPLKVEPAVIDARVNELALHHPGRSDCRVVAEVELAQLPVLLSCDLRLISRLRVRARVDILRPSELWKALEIPVTANPLVEPATGHPLFDKTWWRFNDGA